MEDAMTDLSLANYERALDDITRRGIAAIRGTQRRVDSTISKRTYAARTAVNRVEKVQDAPLSAVNQVQKVRNSREGATPRHGKVRPYAALAIAGFVGIAWAALRR
jgi:hypothetical protein